MCKKAILPTIMESDLLGSDIANLMYAFNRWINMLKNYGKLDSSNLTDDFNAISRVLKNTDHSKAIRNAVKCCRDYALAESINAEVLTRSLRHALRLMRASHENPSVRRVRKQYDDLGMTERYSHLSKKLANEKIRKIGKSILFTDERTDDVYTTKLVRRFVEKRAAQATYRIAREKDLDSNSFRQAVRRAVSFSLYKKNYVEYDVSLRMHGTHWKVSHAKSGKTRLVAKRAYNSFEEALAACERHILNNPNDPRAISPYMCEYCGKWHIGHERLQDSITSPEESTSYDAC
ncbi:MAG: hypothetical protein K2K97_06440 [Muribaculaceae bacterium]|nr:hypothetical protein [Muribaculaceae bacterium]